MFSTFKLYYPITGQKSQSENSVANVKTKKNDKNLLITKQSTVSKVVAKRKIPKISDKFLKRL